MGRCSVSEIETRQARPEDTGQILDVLRASLGETPMLKRTAEQWTWKHAINPFGPSIVLVASSGQRVVAVRALMRWQLLTPDGDVLECLRPVDTATHPDFERRGIFRRLTMEALEVAREQGAHLVFNTPNPKSGAGYISMGWKTVGRIGVLVRPKLGRALSPHGASAPSLSSVIPDAETFHPVEIAERPPRGLRTRRTVTYQAWRFGSHPTVRYGLVGSGTGRVVLRAGVRGSRVELVVSDLLGGAGRAEVREAARSSRARYLAGFFSKGSPDRRSAISAGMLPVPGVRALTLVALPLTSIDIDVFDLGCWDIATSDLELL
jgi:N-acetylglutamate synthase-like GNAT family acetyltransferase